MPIKISNSETETRRFAADFAGKLKAPALICLYGNLGSGKTVFTKGIAAALGIPENQIKSPTYTLVREYKHGKTHFYHFDFYRIEQPDDLMSQDLAEIFAQKNAFIVVEWPERISSLLPAHAKKISFEYKTPNQRLIRFEHD